MSNNKSRWYFTKEALINTPSRKCGMDYDKELSNRQQAANLIQDMGRLLNVNQLCINTAIVYMHRFYVFHSFQRFHRNPIAACALFLAAKVEEQPRKLEYVIKVAHKCLNNNQPPLDPKSDAYQEQAQELIVNENIMLQTLGFDIAIEHPHTFVVKCCQLVRASKDLAQTSYFMATNSLHLTTMCLQYRPTVVACVCIHLACKWSNWEIPKSTQGKDWFFYVDKEVTAEMLEELTSEFLAIWDKCPSRLKRKILGGNASQGTLTNEAITHLTPKEDRKVSPGKNETKSKPASTSGYNQPSTSKTGGQSASTPIPVPRSNKKRSPSPTTKKPKEEPTRTHSMPHPSSTSGQSSNVHNSLGMDALSTTLDNRQRSQLKDDKKSTVSKVENKSKPPQPLPSQPPSSSHHSQVSASRQSSEMTSSQHPPLGSNDYDKRSPSPAARRNEKEMPPLLHRPQTNSRSSSGQNVDLNSVSYNTHSGNSSFTNETRHRSAFKEERKVSPVKNETKSKPVSSTSGYNQSTSKMAGQSNFVPASISSSNKKRSPSPPIKKIKEEPIRTHSISHASQGSGQLSNVHNSLGMDALNTVPDNRQRLQSKDDKKHSLLKTESKSKPPPPLQSQPQPQPQPQPQTQPQPQPQQQPQQQQPQLLTQPQLQSQLQPQLHLQPQSQLHPLIQPPSLSHSGQLPVLRQSSEMTSIQHQPLGSNDYDKKSPSPVARVNEKEMPPLLHRPQTNSRSSSGQNVDHNSVSYNTHSLGNSSSTNETRPKSAFKVENQQHHHQNKHHHRHHEHKKHHKDKHKRKHKHKDRDREKHRSDHDHEEANHKDKDLKLTIPVPQEEEKPSPIKLKISKKQISYSGSESELNNEPSSLPPSLRVVISKDRLGGNSSIGNHSLSRSETVNLPSTSTSRKRKNSPRDELSFQERDLKIKKEKLND